MRNTIFALVSVLLATAAAADQLDDALRSCEAGTILPKAEMHKRGWVGFRAQITAIDLPANAFAVQLAGKTYVVHVTSETTICYKGRPSSLREARVGEWIGGVTKPSSRGSIALHLGLGTAGENHPYGIPAPHQENYLISPYAKDKPPFYVGRIPIGALVKCPYTGNLLVRPQP